MIPSNFDQANSQLLPPEGMSEDEVGTLCAYRGVYEETDEPFVVTCFKPTREELDEIEKTGRVWVIMLGESIPPISISSENPWESK